MSHSTRHGKYAKHRQNQKRYWHMLWSEPKWHRKLHKTRKRRQSCRWCVYQVMKGNEDVLWPLNTRPWFYYY